MGSKSVEDLLDASTGVHFSGFHLDGLGSRNLEATTSATESVHKQPFVIG